MLKSSYIEISARSFSRNASILHDIDCRGERILLTLALHDCLMRLLWVSGLLTYLGFVCFCLFVSLFLMEMQIQYLLLSVFYNGCCFLRPSDTRLGVECLKWTSLPSFFQGFWKYFISQLLHINMHCFKRVVSFHCLLWSFYFS